MKHGGTKPPSRKQLLLLCDGGMRVEPFKDGYMIDLVRIREQARSIAPIQSSWMFDYQDGSYEHRIKQLYDQNFFYVTCPRIAEAEKSIDKTDYILNRLGYMLVPYLHDVTNVVIMASDGDFVPLVSLCHDRWKEVHLFYYKKHNHRYNSVLDQTHRLDIASFGLVSHP